MRFELWRLESRISEVQVLAFGGCWSSRNVVLLADRSWIEPEEKREAIRYRSMYRKWEEGRKHK